MRFGIFLPPFHYFADPRRVADLAARAELAGWDGVFVWDHMLAGPETPIADPWVSLTAIALATSRLRIGTMVTPLARRRPWVLARQAASVDLLSDGRLVLGVGLGDDGWTEFSSFGELAPAAARATLLDESLAVLTGLLSGAPVRHDGAHLHVDTTPFRPGPLQRPLPMWGACRWPRRASMARAAGLAGCFPIFASGGQTPPPPEPGEVAEVRAALRELGAAPGHDLVLRAVLARLRAGQVEELEQAGATWLLEAVDPDLPDPDAVEHLVATGPPPVRLIGAGWGRTGTTSLAAALDRLGVTPCVHMREMWEHPELVEAWNRAGDGEPVDWRSLLRDWQAGVDWPACWQWREFAELWPDAPVLLTVRDPAAWYDSVLGSIHAWTAPGTDVGPTPVARLITRVWDREFGGWARVLDREHTIGRFLEHNESVRRDCAPQRLVEWRPGDGWEPLCRALGVAVPNTPFPHLNARDDGRPTGPGQDEPPRSGGAAAAADGGRDRTR